MPQGASKEFNFASPNQGDISVTDLSKYVLVVVVGRSLVDRYAVVCLFVLCAQIKSCFECPPHSVICRIVNPKCPTAQDWRRRQLYSGGARWIVSDPCDVTSTCPCPCPYPCQCPCSAAAAAAKCVQSRKAETRRTREDQQSAGEGRGRGGQEEPSSPRTGAGEQQQQQQQQCVHAVTGMSVPHPSQTCCMYVRNLLLNTHQSLFLFVCGMTLAVRLGYPSTCCSLFLQVLVCSLSLS